MKNGIVFVFGCYLQIIAVSAQSTIDKNQVSAYFQDQQYDEAIAYLTPFAVTDSMNLQWLGFIAYASFMTDNSREAANYYQRILAIDSNNITANHYLAVINTNTNPALARSYTRRLLRLQPNKALYCRNMAELYKKTSQKDSALFYDQQAYRLSPGDYKNAAGLADLLINNKTYPAADSILEKGLLGDSFNIPCLRLSVRSAYEKKDYQAVLLPGHRLVRLNDISLAALSELAVSYYNLKMYSDCVDVCELMLSNELDAESIYYYEARAWAKLKNFKESNDLLQICLSKALSKTAELYYYNLGENYENMKQYGMAVKQYDSAYYLFKNPLMKYYPARVYETYLKNEKLARKYFVQYLALATPETPDEKKAYEYIKSKYGAKKKITAGKK